MMGENIIMIDTVQCIIGERMLVRNTLWMLGGQGFRVMIQALYFILLSRLLGAEGLGTFVGVVSLVGIVGPFANLGSGNLLVKNAARDPRLFRAYWGRGLMVTSVTASSLIAAILLASSLLLPKSVPFGLVLCVALADLLFARLLELSSLAFMAFQRLRRTAQLQAMLSLSRLVAAAWLGLAGPAPTAATWSCCYLAASACVGVAAVLVACRELGRPGLDRGRHASELGDGVLFSIGDSTEWIYGNIDKYMLLGLSAPGTAGFYAAASRLIERGVHADNLAVRRHVRAVLPARRGGNPGDVAVHEANAAARAGLRVRRRPGALPGRAAAADGLGQGLRGGR